MQPIRTFNVMPSIPERLEPLRKLAYNLYWSWSVEIKDLFRRLDPDLWNSTRHNPVLMLGKISQERLLEAVEDDGLVAQMHRSVQQLDDYLARRTWFDRHRTGTAATTDCYAYYSAEFGLTDCLPIYSGGLGILAGDHLKSASDLGLPLVGVGLLYQKGYFAQYLNPDGWQQERYPINDFYNMPLHLERNPDGSELRIGVDYPTESGSVKTVYARIWRIQVGSVPLYLLDTNIEPNIEADQDITDYLYGGDIDVRIRQEMMLGIGGTKALQALGIQPTAYHMNEGHAGFLSLERLRHLILDQKLSFTEAVQMAQSTQIFTTHTPVPAGIDLFPPEKVWYYLSSYCDRLGISKDAFLSLGREQSADAFSMAVFAIKMATFINGVSKLHGAVSREMFNSLWHKLPEDEVPITAVTNGVHARTWVYEDTQDLYDRYFGPSWSSAAPDDRKVWDRVSTIPDEELWRNHERCRARLVVFARERLKHQLNQWGSSPSEIQEAGEALDPTALTVGFARRFATYKRGTLFMYDLKRIKNLLQDRDRKLQFIIAGKAHPKDIPGKELIRDIVRFSREEDVRHRVVFIEDYDTYVSGLMLAGCDIWLNTPLRPREASGTSGMKAAMNGCLNLSVLDGWWDEADYIRTGWPIGMREEYDELEYQNRVESNAIYELLEKDALPLFYQRNEDGVPRGWVAKMKDAITLNTPLFNTARMVRDYATEAYIPASDRNYTLNVGNYDKAKELSQWKSHLSQEWQKIQVKSVDFSEDVDVKVSQPITVKAEVYLAGLTPDDVQVELYQGNVAENGHVVNGTPVLMQLHSTAANGNAVYTIETSYANSGLHGMALRILPKHPTLSNSYEPRLIYWA